MSFKLGKRGQMTVYVAEDVSTPLLAFANEHPIASASDITNAALRWYLGDAQQGVDGRLTPTKRADGTTASGETVETLRKMIDELQERFEEQRRTIWTEQQRREHRSKKKGAPSDSVVPIERYGQHRKARPSS